MPLDLSPATAGESGIDGLHRAKPHTECAHTHSRLPTLTGRRGETPSAVSVSDVPFVAPTH